MKVILVLVLAVSSIFAGDIDQSDWEKDFKICQHETRITSSEVKEMNEFSPDHPLNHRQMSFFYCNSKRLLKGCTLRTDVLESMMKQKYPDCELNMKKMLKKIKKTTKINPKHMQSRYDKVTFIRHVFDQMRRHLGTSPGDYDFNCVCRHRNRT